MKMVKAEGLSYAYTRLTETDHGTEEKKITALEQVDIEIEKGEFIVVLGHNGSGKSTFAKHINALLQPTGGTLWVKGMDTQQEEKSGTYVRRRAWCSRIRTTSLWQRLWRKILRLGLKIWE